MKKIVFLFSFIFCMYSSSYSQSSYSQSSDNITIKEIHQQVNNLATIFKSNGQADEMYIKLDEEGNRWLYIEDKSLDGLRGEEEYFCLKLSKVTLNLLYQSFYYDRERTTSLKGFTDVLKSKNIKGIKYKTHNNDFFFSWDKILNFDQKH